MKKSNSFFLLQIKIVKLKMKCFPKKIDSDSHNHCELKRIFTFHGFPFTLILCKILFEVVKNIYSYFLHRVIDCSKMLRHE